MSFPREFRVGGSSHVVAGVDIEHLVADATSLLDRYFSELTVDPAGEERDRLVARFDQVIPSLKKEARGYLAMGREVLRRLPVAE